MSDFKQQLAAALEQRKSQQRYRVRSTVDSPQGPHLSIDDTQYVNFCSNDYLGLANHPEVVTAFHQAVDRYGVGSGASHLVHGHYTPHQQLEEALAAFTGRERAVVFSTGYMANLGVVSALTDRHATIYEDRLNHASLIDAGQLSRASVKRFHHNDIQQLEQLLAKDTSRRKFIVVDGVFSMDGDTAKLPELAELCARYRAQLMIDDAHGFGVLGDNGGGCTEYFQLSQEQLPILVGTFGKALGTFGAFVAGSCELIETLIQFARPYIYTTALPPAVAAATLASLKIIQQDALRRERLHQNITFFRQQARCANLSIMDSSTAIQPVVLGDDYKTMEIAKKLKQDNIIVGAIRPPTVPEGTARLRITLNSEHTQENICDLLEALKTHSGNKAS